jgi:hypothetical protein
VSTLSIQPDLPSTTFSDDDNYTHYFISGTSYVRSDSTPVDGLNGLLTENFAVVSSTTSSMKLGERVGLTSDYAEKDVIRTVFETLSSSLALVEVILTSEADAIPPPTDYPLIIPSVVLTYLILSGPLPLPHHLHHLRRRPKLPPKLFNFFLKPLNPLILLPNLPQQSMRMPSKIYVLLRQFFQERSRVYDLSACQQEDSGPARGGVFVV